jgi:pimeloyl-ACP methyl ester carboxylesterase
MIQAAPSTPHAGQYIRANGADIYYVEAGQGDPLLLLHGGFVSTSPVWTGVPVAYDSHLATFAEHFRVIGTRAGTAGRSTLVAAPFCNAVSR